MNTSTGSSPVRKQPCSQNVGAGDLLTISQPFKNGSWKRICKCCKTWSPSKFISSHKLNLLISLHDYKPIKITQHFQLQNTKRDESWWRALIFLGLAAGLLNVAGQQHYRKMKENNVQIYLDKIKRKAKTQPIKYPPKWQSKAKCLNLSTFPRTAHLAQAPRTKHKMPFTLLLKSTRFNELHRTETKF